MNKTPVVEVITSETFDHARAAATDETTNSGAIVYPVVLFRQGDRLNLSGAISIKKIGHHVETTNSSKKGNSPAEARDSKNRPIMQDHVNTIADYIKENAASGKYIIPPVTLNVKEHMRVYTGPGSSTVKVGYLVLPETANIEITDGQHRIKGTLQALQQMVDENRDAFGQDAIAFMLTCEDDVRQIHQDFADCSKTKQIPASLLTVYDLRQPANGLVMDLMEMCPVFKHKIDSTGTKIGKNSLKLFVTNQVRQMVKTLLTGDMALGEPQFVDRAKELLPDEIECKKTLAKFVDFINLLTEHIEPWKEAASIVPGPGMNKVKNLRDKQSISLTATGLVIIGRIGYELFNSDEVSDWKPFAEKLGKLNYQKSNPVWKDVLAPKTNKAGEKVWSISTQRSPVMKAVARVRQEIGLDPEPRRKNENIAAEATAERFSPVMIAELATPENV